MQNVSFYDLLPSSYGVQTGVSGSGKTYTMSNMKGDANDIGIIPRGV